MVVADGLDTMTCMPMTQLSNLIISGEVQENSIVSLLDYSVNQMGQE